MTIYEKQFYEVIIRELPKISKSLNNIQLLLMNEKVKDKIDS